MKTFDEVFRRKIVLEECEKAFREIVNTDETFKDDDFYSMMICEMVDGSYGCHMPSAICDLFGITPQEIDDTVVWNQEGEFQSYDEFNGEYVWLSESDWIDRYPYIWDFLLTEVENGSLLDEISKKLERGYLYFGTLDADGTYGLFFGVDAEVVDEVRREASEVNVDNQ